MAALPASMDSKIHLTVEVPTGANLFVNEQPTTNTGATREFVSRDLERGKKYEFKVRAEVVDKNGKSISETKQVSMQAGDSETLQFTFINWTDSLAATNPK
jgi:uncharacterized protein (TIGR03000 family)